MDTKKIKPVKKIIIRNPRLRAIRDNLRAIIKLAVIDEYKRLTDLRVPYQEKEKLTPSQKKRVKLLHWKREYLITTFANSICVCARRRIIHDNDVKGDRVRVSVISEFEENMVPHLGARYFLQEKWYSLQYYEENRREFEEYSRFMQECMDKRPGSIITPQEDYQLGLKLLRKYGTVAPKDWIYTTPNNC